MIKAGLIGSLMWDSLNVQYLRGSHGFLGWVVEKYCGIGKASAGKRMRCHAVIMSNPLICMKLLTARYVVLPTSARPFDSYYATADQTRRSLN